MSVSEIARQIALLSAPEKENLLHQLAAESVPQPDAPAGLSTPVVVKTPDVCGGAARIIRTRIPVWTLQQLRHPGVTEADILQSYPVLRAIDFVQAWQYVENHREEIDRQILENEQQ